MLHNALCQGVMFSTCNIVSNFYNVTFIAPTFTFVSPSLAKIPSSTCSTRNYFRFFELSSIASLTSPCIYANYFVIWKDSSCNGSVLLDIFHHLSRNFLTSSCFFLHSPILEIVYRTSIIVKLSCVFCSDSYAIC